MKHNYQNPKTKKTFHIAFVKSRYNKEDRCMNYFDRDGDLIKDPEDGTVLVPYVDLEYIGDSEGTIAIRTPTKNR